MSQAHEAAHDAMEEAARLQQEVTRLTQERATAKLEIEHVHATYARLAETAQQHQNVLESVVRERDALREALRKTRKLLSDIHMRVDGHARENAIMLIGLAYIELDAALASDTPAQPSDAAKVANCKECDGSGKIRLGPSSDEGTFLSGGPCPTCGGTGKETKA